jgi:hypothetical protein
LLRNKEISATISWFYLLNKRNFCKSSSN